MQLRKEVHNMVIVYESRTGFTKRYVDLFAAKAKLEAYSVKELPRVDRNEEVIFFGWMRIGKIQGLTRLRGYNVIAVCCVGSGQKAEPDTETVISRNRLADMPFFYMRGGCLPLRQIKGWDRIMLSMFVRMLKSRRDQESIEAVSILENGMDAVKEENLQPLLDWLGAR